MITFLAAVLATSKQKTQSKRMRYAHKSHARDLSCLGAAMARLLWTVPGNLGF